MKAIDLLEPGRLQRSALYAEICTAGSLPPGTRLGPFKIERELARGGMGVVYLAARADGEYEQRVAIKVTAHARISDEVFRRERQILADLRHPHIARLVDGGRDQEGHPWLAMELIEGQRLDQHCVDRALPTADRLRLFLAVCAAVHFAHGRGVLHRDLKPANVMVDADGSAKLLDFGIADLIDEGGEGLRAYTPGYASPEQLRGEPASIASDVFQLGRLLAALLSSDHEERATVLGEAGTSVNRRVPGGLDADLRAVIGRAQALDPAQRYASAAALADDVRAVLERRPVSARPRHAGYLLTRFTQRHPWGVGLGSLVVLSVLILSLAFAHRLGVERDQSRLAAQRAEATAEFLLGLFRDGDPTRGIDPGLTARELIQTGADRLIGNRQLPPEVRRDLSLTLAEIQSRLAEHARAEALLAEIDPGAVDPVRLLIMRGRIAAGQGRPQEAAALYRQALAMRNEAQIELLLARAESDGGDAAGPARLDALLARRDSLPPAVRFSVLLNAGVMRWRAAKPQEALDLLDQSLAVIEGLSPPASPAPVHINAALALIDLARFDDALARLSLAEQALERFPNRGYAIRVLQQRGIVHFRRNDYEAARESWQQALEASANGVDPSMHGAALHNLATTFEDNGDALQALDFGLRAAIARAALGDRPGALSSRINAAVKLGHLARADLAQEMALAAIADARSMQRPDLEGRAQLALAAARRRLGDPAAFQALDAALAAWSDEAYRSKRLDAHHARALAAIVLGDADQYQRARKDFAREVEGLADAAQQQRAALLAAWPDPLAADAASWQSAARDIQYALILALLREGRAGAAAQLLQGISPEPNAGYYELLAAVAKAQFRAAAQAQAEAQVRDYAQAAGDLYAAYRKAPG